MADEGLTVEGTERELWMTQELVAALAGPNSASARGGAVAKSKPAL